MHTIPVLNAFLFIELHRELLKTCLLSSPLFFSADLVCSHFMVLSLLQCVLCAIPEGPLDL